MAQKRTNRSAPMDENQPRKPDRIDFMAGEGERWKQARNRAEK
jgi:hypothetical protein